MHDEEILSGVLETIVSIAPETDIARVRHDAPLGEQLDLDSFDWLNVLEALRERFGVSLAETDLARRASVRDVVARLASVRPRGGARTAADLLATRPIALNGACVTLRPIRRDDLVREADFVRGLSAETRYERFMASVRELPQSKLRYLTDVDQQRHVALAATVTLDGDEALVGVARYIVDASGSGCEFAITVADAWHGTGLAGALMNDLVAIARARGLARMEGIVLATNATMLRFARQLGFRAQHDPGDRDTVRVVRQLTGRKQ